MKNIIFFFFASVFIFQSVQLKSQEYFWLEFIDKNNSGYSFSQPEKFLSERAIQRRAVQNIAIDSLDLPVNSEYINQVLQLGVSFVHSSKWLNGITVKVEIDSFETKVFQLPFIKEIQLTKPAQISKSAINKFYEIQTLDDDLYIDTSFYGASVFQVGQLNGQFLHNLDFRGQGMQIAILDGGFLNTNVYPAFDSLWANNQILGTIDFVNPDENIFETSYHGMSVLSCMGGNIPGELIGTSPKASYWLMRTEDTNSEYLIEEDNWVAAAEYADSAGIDVINSSLGYYLFDDKNMDHSYVDMDGKTTRVTKGANIAASRGILVFASAGNEGNDPWKYIIAPSDGDSVLGIGAVNKDGAPAYFTSFGPASDGDIKPNVSAIGWNTFLQKSDGSLGYSSGTSFSSPVMAGMAACLWQANPQSTAFQVRHAIEQSAHLFLNPDSLLGFGIPDMKLANQILQTSLVKQWENQNNWLVYPNPLQDYLVLQKAGVQIQGKIEIAFYTADGRLVRKEQKDDAFKIILRNLQSLPTGLLILKISSENSSETLKLNKSR
ncbi:MAG: S8 family serine peptidase [Prolixibacteraceae bacterium]|jgi:serine protease AprX|nr:S8 family serine peptidase [Prolixibacteraceae bacterium]